VSRRAVLLALALMALLAPVALAGTSRTSFTPEQIRSYHESGRWDRDVARVFASARRSLVRALARPGARRRPAIVLDIDETSLSNYPCLDAADFNVAVGLGTCVGQGRSVAIPAARRFVAAAQKRHVTVFFITAAPDSLEASRRANLRKARFRGRFTVIGRPATVSTEPSQVPYKSGERRAIERRGYRILVNVGDQRTDLAGGYARARFLVPNRIYVTT
jgi:predicted secreted acid phosphatase